MLGRRRRRGGKKGRGVPVSSGRWWWGGVGGAADVGGPDWCMGFCLSCLRDGGACGWGGPRRRRGLVHGVLSGLSAARWGCSWGSGVRDGGADWCMGFCLSGPRGRCSLCPAVPRGRGATWVRSWENVPSATGIVSRERKQRRHCGGGRSHTCRRGGGPLWWGWTIMSVGHLNGPTVCSAS